MPLTARTHIRAELLGSLGWRAPFQAKSELPATIADVYEVPIASGTVNQPLTLPPGITTITTLWVTSSRAVSITIGPVVSNQAKDIQPNGIIGFAGGQLAAAGAVSVSYTDPDGQPVTVFLYVAGV